MKLPTIFKRNGKPKVNTPDPDLKNRVLKNKEAVLDIMGEKIEGNRSCPAMLGQQCIGKFCMKFMEFKQTDDNGEEKSFWNCADVQTPLLIIELNRNIRHLTSVMQGGQRNEENS